MKRARAPVFYKTRPAGSLSFKARGYTLRIFLSRKNRGQAFNNVEFSRNSIGRMIIIRPGARATPHIRLRMAIGPAAL
ncbi:hypothetical protein SXCC_02644 [Gluconacetobacter sp. SXCC-1]|nr:hypothetical protein [Komagataeibacter rhaeticus]EGG76719.1 hypothetical protein SXCC_02644 [Gluconacetobacter sp. SXCC-1]QOC47558.1 hypothetical protein ICJ78_05615 [Komagataeibacter rhaeticus]WPP22642.1 hypothetical protein SCD25_03880 [Komagataeibacter rhaeticus]